MFRWLEALVELEGLTESQSCLTDDVAGGHNQGPGDSS